MSEEHQNSPSQKERILRYLRAGGRITPMGALRLFGSMRLGARIWDLKQEGHNIQDRLIETDSGKMVSEYWLEREPARPAGPARQTALQF